MRTIALIAFSLLAFTLVVTSPLYAAGNVVSTYGTTNLNSTDWSMTDCNGTHTALQCTLNGSDATGEGGRDGRGDNGKH